VTGRLPDRVGSTVGLTRSGPRRRTCVGRWNLAAIATAASASRTAPWEGRPAPTTRQAHPAGESMFVDHAGQTVDLLDGSAGEIRPAQIFVAVTDASNYAYAEATPTQGLPDRSARMSRRSPSWAACRCSRC